MNRNPLHITDAWRRRLSNAGVCLGLLLIAAPPAMQAYGTWWEERQTALFLAQADEQPAPGTPTPAPAPAPSDGAAPEPPAKPEATAPEPPARPEAATPLEPAKPAAKPPVTAIPTQAPAKQAAKARAGKTPARAGRAKTAQRPANRRPVNRIGAARANRAWRESLLEIPSIGVEAVVKRASGNWKWEKGPAYDPKSAAPGTPGNAVIAAHRNMWARTFARLPRVKPGDRIAIRSKGKRHIYVVEWSRKVRTSDTSVLANTKEPCVTLYTCVVPFRASQRWVVRARLVDTQAAAPSSGRMARSR